MPMAQQDIEVYLHRRWSDGAGIDQTRRLAKQTLGVELGFEQIRGRFVEFSWGRCNGSR